MPPETVAGKSYSGESVDLFSASIICFIILSGGPPFRMPKFDDSHYKHIVAGNFTGFWKLHEHFTFSETFKDFILAMFCDSASLRLSVSEI